MQAPSLGGVRYYVAFKDDYSSFQFVFCIAQKFEALRCFKQVVATVRRDLSTAVVTLRTDRGEEFKNHHLVEFCLSEGIHQEFTAPYCPEQNGMSERDNRTIVEAVRSMLHLIGPTLQFWAEATHTAVHVLNRTGTRRHDAHMPFQMWTEHQKVFGCTACAYIPKSLRQKLDAQNQPCFFLGYCEESKA